MQWTQEQERAIQARGCNVLVAAAAGSGKTAVLVERIIQLITDPAHPVDIDRMLITTFTEAAAAKMKFEIAQALESRLEQTPQDKNLSRQLVLLNNANICTVHAFCMRVVKSGFQKLDIEPDFSIGEQAQMKLLLNKTMDALFETLYEEGDAGFLDLLESYAKARSDAGLRDILFNLYAFVSSLPFKQSYFEAVQQLYAVSDIHTHPWFCLLVEHALLRLRSSIDRLSRYRQASALYEGMLQYTAALEDEIGVLRLCAAALAQGDTEKAGALARDFTLGSARVGKGEVDAVLKQQISKARKSVGELMFDIANVYFPADTARMLSDLENCGKKAAAIGKLILQLDTMYFEEKKRRGVLDFSDLEHLTVQLLCTQAPDGTLERTQEAEELAKGLDYILVDEFQDTNELQDTIFSMLSNGDNLFMVGDVKQSIYRFRHTNPYIFKAKKDSFSDTEGINRRVIMSKNFRSRQSVIDSINQVFSRIASERIGEITYDATERLNVGAAYPAADGVTAGGKTEILLAPKEMGLAACEAEAHMVAQRICKLFDSGYTIYDAKAACMRPLRYKDIAVLMRSHSKEGPVFAEILESYGIPAYVDAGGGYFDNTEITLMLSLLRILDNPYQDIDLIAVLRSVLFGFDENELLQIRLCETDAPFYDAVRLCANGEGALAGKCAAFTEQIQRWRSYVLYMSTYELIAALYRDTEFDLFVTGQRNGAYRRENLNMLFERARTYEGTGFKGLFDFISYLDGLKNASAGDEDAKLVSDAQDAVHIMSIHKSKGLEFGVVFLARAAKKFYTRDLSSVLLMHKTLGLGFDYVDKLNCYRYPTVAKAAIREKLRLENLSEEMRILYVAMTRAREKLIITGTDEQSGFAAYQTVGENGHLSLYVTAGATCYLDWILPAVLMQACRTVDAAPDTALETDLFLLRRVYAEQILAAEEQAQTEAQAAPPAVVTDATDYAYLHSVMTYTYPHMADTALPSKVSVTELKRMLEAELDPEAVGLYDAQQLAEPVFEENAAVSGMRRGTVTHFVMQHLDLDKDLSERTTVEEQLMAMVGAGMLTQAEADLVHTDRLAAFFAGAVGARMLASNAVQRELPFEIMVKGAQLFSDYDGESSVLVQGIIDCFFEEPDGIVLLDYKTDHVKDAADIERIKARYRVQINYYVQAIEQITQKRVKEKYLHLFSARRTVEM